MGFPRVFYHFRILKKRTSPFLTQYAVARTTWAGGPAATNTYDYIVTHALEEVCAEQFSLTEIRSWCHYWRENVSDPRRIVQCSTRRSKTVIERGRSRGEMMKQSGTLHVHNIELHPFTLEASLLVVFRRLVFKALLDWTASLEDETMSTDDHYDHKTIVKNVRKMTRLQ